MVKDLVYNYGEVKFQFPEYGIDLHDYKVKLSTCDLHDLWPN